MIKMKGKKELEHEVDMARKEIRGLSNPKRVKKFEVELRHIRIPKGRK